jgi:Fe-S-cluster containining protein
MNEPTSSARVHMRWLETERSFPVPLPPAESTLLDLLPTARVLCHEATAAALEQARSQGKEISCRAGCGACCRQLVAISMIEAQSLADLVASMPPERQAILHERFAHVVARLEEAGLLDANEPRGERSILAADLGSREASLQGVSRRYFQLQLACPFLENESCSIHEQRPVICREHHVTTPAENCARLYELNVDRVEPALRVGEALARTADKVGGHGSFMIPLALSLAYGEENGAALKVPRDGKKLFEALMGELEAL